MFINFSNHPHENWDKNQIKAASEYGSIVDVPFPAVEALAGENEIAKLADEYVARMVSMLESDSAVMVQGEFTLTYAVINLLKKRGIKAISACSERDVVESIDDNGNTYGIF